MLRSIALASVVLALTPLAARAQAFVEYPSHPATYGDHAIAATWPGGPVSVVVEFESDESVLHGDGLGQSQRTARNTLTFLPPSASSNPQDYDDLQLVARYSGRLPLLQQMSSNGVSVLRYRFGAPVASGFDLFVTDVDSGDSVSVRAFDANGGPVDMRTWPRVAGGDLSWFKDTGTAFSSIVAPAPLSTVSAEQHVLVAFDGNNANRSYTILRAPAGPAVASVELQFRGLQNSASRAAGGTGAHVYTAIATSPPLTDAPLAEAGGWALRVTSPARGAIAWSYSLDAAERVRLELLDVTGRRRLRLDEGERGAGVHAARTRLDTLPAGLYWLRLAAGSRVLQRRVIVLE